MYLLKNTIQPYAWGSPTAISHALNQEPSGGPEAELWIGAHPKAPSLVASREAVVSGALPASQSSDSGVELDQFIARDPETSLGADVRKNFGDRLPFLLKLLAADAPLSLQVHPNRQQAQLGFQREEAQGIPLTAAHRNYRDNNHKPELLYALTDFRALCGFRSAAESAELFAHLASLTHNPTLENVADVLAKNGAAGIQPVFETLITGGPEITTALDQSVAALTATPPNDSSLRTVVELAEHYHGDPGALISLLLNLVELRPGQVLALSAGNVHAYLQGFGVEVMATSDNVLRGGLTNKHVDVPELLATIDFRPLPIPWVSPQPQSDGSLLFDPGFGDFQLQTISGQAAVTLRQEGPVLMVVLGAAATLHSPEKSLELAAGQSVFIPATEVPTRVELHGEGTAFAVTCGVVKKS